jgi:glycosyltransferase involved in cell wall biosynthesis
MFAASFESMSQTTSPLVSVVIPTKARAELVQRAIRSVLNQTYTSLEVIVVVDGDDPVTIKALRLLPNRRLRVIALESPVGGAEARNIGARDAAGQWIALLDDDDEWLPNKIEAQMSAAYGMKGTDYVFIASRYIERTANGDRVLPARSLEFQGSYSDFLFCRNDFRSGTGYVQTSTWLVSKELMYVCPFTTGLKRNQDADWLLHAMAVTGVKMLILEEPLSIFNEDPRVGRVSKQPDWRFQLDWINVNRAYLSRKAYSFCIATLCVPEAVKQNAPARIYLHLLKTCFVGGAPTPLCILFFFYYLLSSDNLRAKIRLWQKVKVSFSQ